MNIEQYLRRIQVDRISRPDFATLAHLQEQHLLTVPFENLSVRSGERIVLDESWLFDKVVRRRRGGFCYELNGLFAWLLSQLGFVVTRVAAGVYQSAPDTFGPTFDHMALLVHLDQVYLVDVGFGDSARKPIPLPNGTVTDISGSYRLVPSGTEAGMYVLQKKDESGWKPQFRFSSQPRALADYGEMCHYHQSSPDSHFTQRTVCTLATPDGRITLSEDALTITRAGEKERISLPTSAPDAQRKQILHDYFGITLA